MVIIFHIYFSCYHGYRPESWFTNCWILRGIFFYQVFHIMYLAAVDTGDVTLLKCRHGSLVPMPLQFDWRLKLMFLLLLTSWLPPSPIGWVTIPSRNYVYNQIKFTILTKNNFSRNSVKWSRIHRLFWIHLKLDCM